MSRPSGREVEGRIIPEAAGSGGRSGSRFSGNDVHAFVVVLVIAAMILGLMIKITFF